MSLMFLDYGFPVPVFPSHLFAKLSLKQFFVQQVFLAYMQVMFDDIV